MTLSPIDLPRRSGAPDRTSALGAFAPDRPAEGSWRAGAPVGASDVVAAWRIASAAGTTPTETLLLLAGGLARRALADSPLSLVLPDADPGTWPPDSPWTLWRTGEGGALELADAGAAGGWRAVHGHPIDASPSPASLHGVHERPSVRGRGPDAPVSTAVLVLDPAGRFARWTQTLSTYASALSALPGTRFGAWERSAVETGAYRLLEDGLTIELTGTGGAVHRELCFVDGGAVHLGERGFRRRDGTADVDALLARTGTERRLVHGGRGDWLTVAARTAAEAADEAAERKRRDPVAIGAALPSRSTAPRHEGRDVPTSD